MVCANGRKFLILPSHLAKNALFGTGSFTKTKSLKTLFSRCKKSIACPVRKQNNYSTLNLYRRKCIPKRQLTVLKQKHAHLQTIITCQIMLSYPATIFENEACNAFMHLEKSVVLFCEEALIKNEGDYSDSGVMGNLFSFHAN